MSDWLWLLALGTLAATTNALSASLMEDVKKADQAMRPKVKRAQESLMFGNQQNRQAENNAANLYSPVAEKRTLGSSGLEDAKATFAQGDKFNRAKQPLVGSMFDRQTLSPYEKNYEYSKILANQIDEAILPRAWDVPSYPRYYNMGDERRKRSDNPIPQVRSTTVPPATSSPITTHSPRQSIAQAKRSLEDPRYKRELDQNAKDMIDLLSILENERRKSSFSPSAPSSPRTSNFKNWPTRFETFDNDDYDGEDENEEDDPRNGGAWLPAPVYPVHHFNVGAETLTPSNIGIPRNYLPSYGEYGNQYGNQYGQQYGGAQYGSAQYGSTYPQSAADSYYSPEKGFIVSRKRSQGYTGYGGRNDFVSLAQLLASQPRSYPGYQHRLVY